MSRQNLPANQQRHDNVSVVRLKAGGCRFEIACYRNKAQSYRNNVEKDIEEVLQIERVFTNVGQGEFAKIEDVRKHLGPKISKSKTLNDEELERRVCLLILDTGVIQLNEKERQAEVEGVLHDVATFIAEKTVHPDTRRPYPVSMVLASLHSMGFAPTTRKPAKTQALEAIKQLSAKNIMQLERAPMLIKGTFTDTKYQDCLDSVRSVEGVKIVSANFEKRTVEFLIPPDVYRVIDGIVKDVGGGSLQVLVTAVTEGSEVVINEATVAMEASPKGREKRVEVKEKEETRGKKGRKGKKGRGGSDDDDDDDGALEGIGGKLLKLDLSSDEEKGRGKKKKKKKGHHQAPQVPQKKKKNEEGEEEVDIDFLTGKKKAHAEKEEKKKKEREAELRADPNYYDSDQFGSDYSDFYNNSDEDLDINEIHAKKEEKKRLEQEEEEKQKEAEEKSKPKVRSGTKKKRKQRNKKGEVVLSDSE